MKASEFFAKNNCTYNYKTFVISQIEGMKIDDMINADIGTKDIASFRMNMGLYGVNFNKKFKTKMVDGFLVVGRIL
tara:strand:+ start:5233 stop:5460 length:228 start_codon:yes stop_codon:yes gene_type:complete